MNGRTGKRALRRGYAPATINHALSVLSSFYAFHAQFGLGPVINPVPASATRRARLAHRSPIDPQAEHRRAPLRQKPAVLMRTRYDKHEHVTSEPQPFLFQRTIGQRTEVITPGALREMLLRLCASLAEQHPQLASIRFTPHDFRRLFATDLANHGLPSHIGAALLGHLNIQTFHGYVAVLQEDVICHYQAHLANRRAGRPAVEYRPSPTTNGPSSSSTSTNAKSNSANADAHTPPRANTNTPASAAPWCASTPR